MRDVDDRQSEAVGGGCEHDGATVSGREMGMHEGFQGGDGIEVRAIDRRRCPSAAISRKYVALLRAVNVVTGTVAMRDIQRRIGLQRNCDVDRGKLGPSSSLFRPQQNPKYQPVCHEQRRHKNCWNIEHRPSDPGL